MAGITRRRDTRDANLGTKKSLIEKIEEGRLVYSPRQHRHIDPNERRQEGPAATGIREHRDLYDE